MTCLYRLKNDDGHYVCKHRDNFGRKCRLIKLFLCSTKELLDAKERNIKRKCCVK